MSVVKNVFVKPETTDEYITLNISESKIIILAAWDGNTIYACPMIIYVPIMFDIGKTIKYRYGDYEATIRCAHDNWVAIASTGPGWYLRCISLK